MPKSRRLVPDSPLLHLSRRERQIMDILYRAGEATAAQVVAGLPDPPTYTAVRGLLKILEDKGRIRHVRDGMRYVYSPVEPRERAGEAVLRNALRTFYRGSIATAMAAMIGSERATISSHELERMARLVEEARRQTAASGKRR